MPKILLALTAWLLLSAASVPAASAATAPTATEQAQSIVQQSNLAALYAGADGRAEARMTIVDSQGRKQTRQFTILRRNERPGGDQDYMLFFSRPADVRGTVFRVAKHVDRADDRWLYLPALDLVKRIAAGDKRTSFVGSHFLYEDVSGRNLAEDSFTLLKITDREFVIKAVPKDPNSVEFAFYIAHIDRKTKLPMRVEYVNRYGDIARRVEVLKVGEVDGKPTVLKSRASTLPNGGFTELEFRFVAYDLKMPRSLFSERSLRVPPRQWLKR